MSSSFSFSSGMPQVGDRIDHYKLSGRLGEGTFGVVYQAQDSDGTAVAIKILKRKLDNYDEARQRFQREAKALHALRHENIVAVRDWGIHHSGDPWMAMELVKGESIKDLLDLNVTFSFDRTVEICFQVLSGLAACHQQDIIHRDIKPGNIVLLPDDTVKIVDFGIVRIGDDPHITVAGAVVGTPAYMSPEQTRGEEVDGRSDLFSCASVLYVMMTGQKPFQGSTFTQVMKSVCVDQHIRPSFHNSSLNPDVDRLFQKAFAKDKTQRFQTARKFQQALTALSTTPATISSSPSHVWSTPSRVATPPPQRLPTTPSALTAPTPAIRASSGPTTAAPASPRPLTMNEKVAVWSTLIIIAAAAVLSAAQFAVSYVTERCHYETTMEVPIEFTGVSPSFRINNQPYSYSGLPDPLIRTKAYFTVSKPAVIPAGNFQVEVHPQHTDVPYYDSSTTPLPPTGASPPGWYVFVLRDTLTGKVMGEYSTGTGTCLYKLSSSWDLFGAREWDRDNGCRTIQRSVWRRAAPLAWRKEEGIRLTFNRKGLQTQQRGATASGNSLPCYSMTFPEGVLKLEYGYGRSHPDVSTN